MRKFHQRNAHLQLEWGTHNDIPKIKWGVRGREAPPPAPDVTARNDIAASNVTRKNAANASPFELLHPYLPVTEAHNIILSSDTLYTRPANTYCTETVSM